MYGVRYTYNFKELINMENETLNEWLETRQRLNDIEEGILKILQPDEKLLLMQWR